MFNRTADFENLACTFGLMDRKSEFLFASLVSGENLPTFMTKNAWKVDRNRAIQAGNIRMANANRMDFHKSFIRT